MIQSDQTASEVAIFGGGCFWCTEAIFSRLRGVTAVIPGYAGGVTPDPTYAQVSQETTGHAEVVKVVFDPEVMPYTQLLEVFWHTHDPTTLNQQGADIGTQYRSIILTTTPEQQQTATAMKESYQRRHEFSAPIVTEVQPLVQFYEAEAYHHDYYQRNLQQPYCQVVITPKLEKLLTQYRSLLK